MPPTTLNSEEPENAWRLSTSHGRGGSSPLTRGKQLAVQLDCVVEGLIPTHAGKTLPDLRFYRADRSDLGKP